MVELSREERRENKKEGDDSKARKPVFNKWLLASCAALGISMAGTNCDNQKTDSYIPIPPRGADAEVDAERDAGVDAETVEPDARVDADEVGLDGGDAEVHEDADTSEDADARVDGGDVDLDSGDAEVHEDADTSEDADARVDGGDVDLDSGDVEIEDADGVGLDADARVDGGDVEVSGCDVFNEEWEGYIRAGAGQNVGGYIVSYLGEGGT
ncbi:MSCRAMM family adhesin SdrC, partial [Candidatus Micrarchaeota archaeon]|nr:MSCRAMM family adhesin SdrC [Candidatus Micrarchaeota archaeon]